MLVVDIKAGERLDMPVDLKTIKGDRAFADLALVRIPRLSVVPVTKAQWDRIRKLSRTR
jgi:predicted RNA-binding protein with PUA-like domain